jgi:hemerythrin-like domain-containing protein
MLRRSSMIELSNPDTHGDLVRIHRLITRALDVSAENFQSLSQGLDMDRPNRDGFISYVQSLVIVIHGHHTLEDEIFFPFFKGRMQGVQFDTFTIDHNIIKELLEHMSVALDLLTADTKIAEVSGRQYELLQKMIGRWHPHIKKEENTFTREHVEAVAGAEELVRLSEEIAKYNQEHSQPLELVVPFLIYNLEPKDRAIFSQRIPSFILDDLVPGDWREIWEPMKPFLLV